MIKKQKNPFSLEFIDFFPAKFFISIISSTYTENTTNTGGIVKYLDCIVSTIPQDDFIELFFEKTATSETFSKFIDDITSIDFMKTISNSKVSTYTQMMI